MQAKLGSAKLHDFLDKYNLWKRLQRKRPELVEVINAGDVPEQWATHKHFQSEVVLILACGLSQGVGCAHERCEQASLQPRGV